MPEEFQQQRHVLQNIENLVICANGPSKVAAEYATYVMRYLGVFNSVRVFEGHDLTPSDLQPLSSGTGGYLTLTQTGASESLIYGVSLAQTLNIPCIAAVNIEEAPLLQVKQPSASATDAIFTDYWADQEKIDVKNIVLPL